METLSMRRPARRRMAAGAVTVVLLSACWTWASPRASADPSLTIHWRVDATTHLAKLDRDVTVPRGAFDGSVDLATGDLTGNLTLPPATVRLDAVPGLLPLADATFAIEQAQPITGHVDLTALQVTATAVFNIRVISVTPLGTSINLVGNDCTTSEPITVVMSGPVNLTGASTFTGEYTIPPLEHCGLPTLALNLLIPGDGNTFTGTFSPPPPPVANAGPDRQVPSQATFQLDGSASSDPENRALTYLWSQIGGPPAVLTNEHTAHPTVKAPKGPATLTFRLTLTNSDDVSATDNVVVTVAAPK